MSSADLKATVIQQLTQLSDDKKFAMTTDSAAERYVSAISLALSKEPASKKYLFLEQYCCLLRAKHFPLLKLDAVQQLYAKWSWHSGIFKELLLLTSKVKLKLDSPEFWKRILLHTASDKSDNRQQSARIQLLICTMNHVKFTAEELEKYGLIFDTILRLHVQIQHYETLKRYLKNDPAHVYYTMFHVLRRCIDAQVTPLEVSGLIQKHYYQLDQALEWKEELIPFFDLLAQKLPPNYMPMLSRTFVGRIIHIYRLNPRLFEQMQPFSNIDLNDATLLRHLFNDFMISGVFLRNFLREQMNSAERGWFMAELNGDGMFGATDLPLVLTKKAAHHFRMLPFEFELKVTPSLVYTSILTQINDHSYAYNVAAALRDDLHLDFWISTMIALHKRGLLARQVLEMMDFIQQKVFVEELQIDVKKRSLQRLLTEMQEWHDELRQLKWINKAELDRSFVLLDISTFEMEYENQKYLIYQLQKGIDLFHEGRILSHCVFSYRYRCYKGASYIFSLRKLDETGKEVPQITIEIVNGEVFQARGKFNRSPTPEEQRIINAWSAANNLIY
jgi:hypothetical protein